MANSKKIQGEQIYIKTRKRHTQEIIDRMIVNRIKDVKKDCLTRLLSDYNQIYKKHRPDITAKMKEIYIDELKKTSSLNSQSPIAHSKAGSCIRKAKNYEVPRSVKRKLNTNQAHQNEGILIFDERYTKDTGKQESRENLYKYEQERIMREFSNEQKRNLSTQKDERKNFLLNK